MSEFTIEVHPSMLLASELIPCATSEQRQLITASIALCAYHEERGDSCVPLALYQEQLLHIQINDAHSKNLSWHAPSLDIWQKELLASDLINSTHFPALLMLEDQYLYLHRLYRHELQLAAFLLQHRQRSLDAQQLDLAALRPRIEVLFPELREELQKESNNADISWQLIAALNALSLPLSIISGGPGTGKTSTVAKLIALLLAQTEISAGVNSDDTNKDSTLYPHIVLAAPTGKAAARVLESLHAQQAQLGLSPAQSAAFPQQALTLHRLRRQLSYNRDSTIDCLIIDETSMADISTLNSCLQLLPTHCRVILLGDPLQLASVESGSVLIDLCAASDEVFPTDFCSLINDHFSWQLPSSDSLNGLQGIRVELKQNWRFKDAPGITALSEAVVKGIENSSEICTAHTDCRLHPLETSSQTMQQLINATLAHFSHISTCVDPAAAIQHLQKCILLCAWKSGPLGVQHCNQQIEQALRLQQHIPEHELWFHGKPFMVSRNNYDLEIYNGDIGVIWHGQAYVDSASQLKVLPLEDIHDCAPLFAMSIHKSQGSQFEHVHVILNDKHLDHVNRSLYYTALTRAKHQLSIWSTPEILQRYCAQSVIRHTRLTQRLNAE